MDQSRAGRDTATDDVTARHERKDSPQGDKRNQKGACHSVVTADVTTYVREGVTTLTPEQMLPLARIIAVQIAQQYLRE